MYTPSRSKSKKVESENVLLVNLQGFGGAGMPTLYILNGPEIGRSAEVQEGVSFLGRSCHNDIRITDGTVSRKHLKILIKEGMIFITDLG
jgi:S-DNA-T family DNA segregation ATPase FtsK/SpoIIIE